MSVSSHTGEGIGEFKVLLDRLCFGESAGGASLTLNSRHLQAIGEARAALARARACIEEGMELLASELRQALDALGQVTGQVTPDDLLGRIFSSFCIGK
jgi:tRNA modification GTPase